MRKLDLWPDYLFECMRCGHFSSHYDCDDPECYHCYNEFETKRVPSTYLINVTTFDDWF